MLRKLALLVGAVLLFASPGLARGEVDFRADVAPILIRRCLGCHGEEKAKGGYQLHSLAVLAKPGASGETPLMAGKPEASYLFRLITETDADARMPKSSDRLPDAEIDLLRKWIQEGARTPGLEPEAPIVNAAQWRHPAAPPAYRRPLPITAVAFRPDGAELAVGGMHEIVLWSAKDGSLRRRLGGLAERTYSMAFTKDGRRLAVACGSPGRMGEVKLLDAESGETIRHFASLSDCALGVALSPDEQRLAACGADRSVRVFEMATGKELLHFRDHADWVFAVAWHPEGTRLASASRDRTCKVLDANTGALVTTFAEHTDAVYSVAYQPDGKRAVSCGADGRLRHWLADDPGWENPDKMDKKKRHQVAELSGFSAPALHLVLSDKFLFACSADRTLKAFDLEKKSVTRTWPEQSSWLFALDFHEPSRRLAVAGLEGRVVVWDVAAADAQAPPVLSFVAAPGLATGEAAASP